MKTIVLLGDSITAGFPVRRLLKGYPVENRGVPADNTDLVLARLEKDVIALQPGAVFILIGTNDMAMGFTNDQTFSNYEAILGRIIGGVPGVNVFVQSILPTRGLENRPLDRIAALNEGIRSIAYAHGADYLDIGPLFADEHGELSERYSKDGLHLLTAGYELWAEYLHTLFDGLE